jgi:hypothetical protein
MQNFEIMAFFYFDFLNFVIFFFNFLLFSNLKLLNNYNNETEQCTIIKIVIINL